MKELRKVVESADVIIHVLDARDPIGTKSSAIEEMVLSNYKKKLVYVLNKSDLVPSEVLSDWLRYLRQSSPAVPFKSNTQNQGYGSALLKIAEEITIKNNPHLRRNFISINLLMNLLRKILKDQSSWFKRFFAQNIQQCIGVR